MTLAQFLQAEKMAQRQFAADVGVSPSYMNEIVQGVKSPSMKVAAKIEMLTQGRVPMSALLVVAKKDEDAA